MEKDNVIGKQANIQIIRSADMFAVKVHGNGFIPISDYKIQSSADGRTGNNFPSGAGLPGGGKDRIA